MSQQRARTIGLVAVVWVALLGASIVSAHDRRAPARGSQLDQELATVLHEAGFTGAIEATLERRLGRRIDHQLADLGRLLWFDTITGLNNDNSCAGCHSPTNGFGDTQSIAIWHRQQRHQSARSAAGSDGLSRAHWAAIQALINPAQQTYLKASSTEANDLFGNSVAVSGRGTAKS